MKYSEKILPNQYENNKLYDDSVSFSERMYEEILKSTELMKFNEGYSFKVHKDFKMESMSVSPIYFSLLETLIMLKPYKKILEIGTFLGATSVRLSNIIGKDGQVTTIEKYDQFANIARENIRNNSKFDNVELHLGDAFKVIEKFNGIKKFDFVFLDGNKERYYEYIMALDILVEDGGMIVVDDIFFHGDSLNKKPSTEKGKGAKKVLNSLKKIKKYRSTILPIGNGCLLLTKKNESELL
jgi:caffeoyl-CoA O-methyltransferase/O-methyltransferase